MAIDMYCDRCADLISPDINGGVRLKLGRREFVFHLCDKCQNWMRMEVKDNVLKEGEWREV